MDDTEATERVESTQTVDKREMRRQKRAATWQAYKSDFRWATPLLFVLVLAIPGFLWGAWQHAPTGEEDLSSITNVTFATSDTPVAPAGVAAHTEPGLVAPFEILSVLLLAALIAGVVIAVHDKTQEEK